MIYYIVVIVGAATLAKWILNAVDALERPSHNKKRGRGA